MEREVKADVSSLRDRYRSSRDAQRTHTTVAHIRPVSADLSSALSVVPVSQSLSPATVPLAAADHVTPDPWHEHLCLHRRSSAKNHPHLTSPSSDSDSVTSNETPPLSSDKLRSEVVCEKSSSVSKLIRDQSHFPFPNRRTPRISETARRLGLYSSSI